MNQLSKSKVIRITTVAMSMELLLENQLRFVNKHYEVIGVSSDKDNLSVVAVTEGIRVHNIEMTRRFTPFKDLISLWKLYCFIKNENPLIVHTHTPKAGTLGIIAAKLARVPNRFHTVAGLPLLESRGFKRFVLRVVEKLTYSCASRIYPNSYGLADILINERLCKREKLKVLGNGSTNGINTTYFSPQSILEEEKKRLRSNLEISSEDFVFIYVGRLVGDKGINELVSAFEDLCIQNNLTNDNFQHVKLLLVGYFEANLDNLKTETLEKIHNNKNIIYVGFQKDVRSYFAISDCLVFPSYREGFPNVVIQAGAMGLPSIVTNINGCNEIITDGENGLIIPVKNSLAIVEAMKKILYDVDLRSQLQINSRPLVVSNFEQIDIWNAIINEYKSHDSLQQEVNKKNKLIRTASVGISLDYLLKGQLAFLQNHYDVIGVASDDGHLHIVKEREKVLTIPVSIRRDIHLFGDIVSLWKLYLLFRKEKPLIVHSITPKAGLLSMIAARCANVPIRIHTFTGLLFPTKTGLFRQLLMLMDRLICLCATIVYPEGEGVKMDLIKNGITNKSLRVLANGNLNGIDIDFFSDSLFSKSFLENFRLSLGVSSSDFVFVFIGRIVGDKGINELINAFSNINNCNVKLLLVGMFEPDLDPLDGITIDRINNNNNIISVGFQLDIRPFMAISNSLVFPSYREGFPNVVLQAGAMGLPSIVSDINGCNEIISDGVNGIIVPPKNVESLLSAMQRMIVDDDMRNVLKSNARDYIVSRFEQKVVWECILKEYIDLEKKLQFN